MPKFNFNVNAIKAHSGYSNRGINSLHDTPSKHGYETKDLQRICVYSHTLENEDKPFYIGQGRLARAFNFILRNNVWKNKVKDLSKVKVDILYIDITIEESIKIEKELIAKYGRISNNTGCLVNENDGDTSISQKGTNNYFFNKHFYGSTNGNYGNKYELNPLSIGVVQIDILGNVIKHWTSATEASEIGNFDAKCISGCCYGKRHLHKLYQWVFEKDFIEGKDYMFIPGKTNSKIYLCFDIYGNYKKTYYNNDELISDGFKPSNVNQVSNGSKKSHKNHIFIDFFKLDKKTKQYCIDNNWIQIND